MNQAKLGLAALLVIAVCSTACSNADAKPPAEVAAASQTTPGPQATTGTPAVGGSALTGPRASYTYMFRSSCGERDGLGSFRVTVHKGEVTDVKVANRYTHLPQDIEMIPSLQGILDEAARAERRGADEVTLRLSPDGTPRSLSIDYMKEAIDDEMCWFASHIDPLS